MELLNLEEPTWSRSYGAAEGGTGAEEDSPEDVQQSSGLAEPLCVWRTDPASIQGELLLVALNPVACAAVLTSLPAGSLTACGTLLLPEVPLTAVGFADPVEAIAAGARTCVICSSPWGVVVLAQQVVPEARAFAWARALLGALPGRRVVVLDTMSRGQYASPDAADASPPLLRCVLSRATRYARLEPLEAVARLENQLGRGGVVADEPELATCCPVLEEPNLVQSVAAALVAECEATHRRAELYVSLELPHELPEAAVAFEGALRHAGFPRRAPETRAYVAALGTHTSASTEAAPFPDNLYM